MEWQIKNVRSGCTKAVERKGMDISAFDKRWEELAPLREAYIGLPEGAQ